MVVISFIFVSSAFILSSYGIYMMAIGKFFRYKIVISLCYILGGLSTAGAAGWGSFTIVARYKYGWRDSAQEHGK
jgi:hypothetical protein